MDLGYGFVTGENRISKQKVCFWLHTDEDITWEAFVWYIADYADVVDYGMDWLIVRIVSTKQREYFYNKVMQYEEALCKNNYEVDKESELWKTHKVGAEHNQGILLRLVTEKVS